MEWEEQYGTDVTNMHAGLRLHTLKILIAFSHCKNGYADTPQRWVILTFPGLLCVVFLETCNVGKFPILGLQIITA